MMGELKSKYLILFVFVVALQWLAIDSLGAQTKKSFADTLEEVASQLDGGNYGFWQAFESVPTFSPDFAHFENNYRDLTDGFDCVEAALLVYDVFKKNGFPVEVWNGPDVLGVWSIHIYTKVFHDGRWITVDFTPPYFRNYPFTGENVTHPVEGAEKLTVEAIEEMRTPAVKPAIISRNSTVSYRYFYYEDYELLVILMACTTAPLNKEEFVAATDDPNIPEEDKFQFCVAVRKTSIAPRLKSEVVYAKQIEISIEHAAKNGIVFYEDRYLMFHELQPTTVKEVKTVELTPDVLEAADDGLKLFTTYVVDSIAYMLGELAKSRR